MKHCINQHESDSKYAEQNTPITTIDSDDVIVGPKERIINNGDIIFGKVIPINDTNIDKVFKDSSEQYKSHTSSVIDRVYTDIKNQDGYETRKVSVRSERLPHIGDMFVSHKFKRQSSD